MNCQLLIEVVNGNIRVHGPTNDPILCFGLLELAKVHLHERLRHQAQAGITPPSADDVRRLGRQSANGGGP